MSALLDQQAQDQRLALTLPALRVLLGSAGCPAVLQFEEDAAGASATVTARQEDETDEQLTARLRQELSITAGEYATSIQSIELAGLGVCRKLPLPAAGRVAGKVAVVTGAAQGFGLGIAEGLIAQGAFVVLADLNEQGAKEQAARLNDAAGASKEQPRAIGVGVNVTDIDSLKAACEQVCAAFGGLDVLISNAGVLKAESVKTQPLEDFAFVTKVNYEGYFACVQAFAPALALMHATDEDTWTDIIQINSKSGLVGSNKNGAYAGGKFGGVGLTQSFALELVTDGIKVNSICPGNFFDGPLWSDPERGLFVQYLNTGKVPGAKTIEDVKKAYEAKVPMQRGCTAQDVMHAVYYLIDQRYETGQAVPVTGGQVMLH